MGTSASAMIASIKSNAALRRGNRQAFAKSTDSSIEDIQYIELSKKENDKIRLENLAVLNKNRTQSGILAVLMVGPLSAIIYFVWLILEHAGF